MRVIRVEHTGGPEMLTASEQPAPEPAANEVLMGVAAAGVNFIDTYQRSGAYPRDLPFVPGLEAAGTVVAVGADVAHIAEGDRVAFAQVPGSYAELVAAPAERVVPVPAEVDDRTAAALLLQGMTAHYLTSHTFQLASGSTALVLAAAGGVGRLLVQLAKQYGATVLATTSTDDKAEVARSAGADHVIRYRDVDMAAAVSEATDGVGADVVYDSVGADTFHASLDCLRPRGTMVLYGQSSGRVDPIDPQLLATKGSLCLTRPILAHHVADAAEFSWRASELFEEVATQRLDVRIDRTWPLAQAAEAHRCLEAGRTTGKLLLEP
jgi:NADPH2:quinone reductase